jgi:hypothetical protein
LALRAWAPGLDQFRIGKKLRWSRLRCLIVLVKAQQRRKLRTKHPLTTDCTATLHQIEAGELNAPATWRGRHAKTHSCPKPFRPIFFANTDMLEASISMDFISTCKFSFCHCLIMSPELLAALDCQTPDLIHGLLQSSHP